MLKTAFHLSLSLKIEQQKDLSMQMLRNIKLVKKSMYKSQKQTPFAPETS